MLDECIICGYKFANIWLPPHYNKYGIAEHILSVHFKNTFIRHVSWQTTFSIFGYYKGFVYDLQFNHVIENYPQILFINPIDLDKFHKMLFELSFPHIIGKNETHSPTSLCVIIDEKILFKTAFCCSICRDVYDCGFPTLEVAISHYNRHHNSPRV